MKKSLLLLMIFASLISESSQAQDWKVWQPATGPGGIYFKARSDKAVYGLKDVAQGKYFAEVDELSNMEQTLTTKFGEKYLVRFAYAHRKAAGDKQLKIYINGAVVYDIFIAENSSSGNFSYDLIEYTSTDSLTSIGFQVVSLSGDPNKGVLIDDISFTSVIEGSNLVAMGSFEAKSERTSRMGASSYQTTTSSLARKGLNNINEDDFELLDPFTNYKIGQYLYHKTNMQARALRNFLLAEKGGYQSNDLDFYLARGYHLNHRFSTAISYYQQYKNQLQRTGPSAKRRLHLVNGFLKNCIAGTSIIADSLALEIKNLGNVNSAYPDYVPLVSADESTLIFTSRRNNSTGREVSADGKFNEDIYISTKNAQGLWSRPKQLNKNINTKLHDAGIGLSADGSQLFVYKESNGGDIYVSKHQGQKWTQPEALKGDVNSKYWEGSVSITADGKYLYFTSNRPGGYGGIDIYRSERMPNGKWGKAANLGPQVNTALDEEAPQIHTDQRTLFFSSKGYESLGGFDIYSTTMDDSGKWSAPKNVGFPINTAGDDLHFSLAADGTKAYFSSAYLSSECQNDLYVTKRPEASASMFLLRGKIVSKKNSRVALEATITLLNKKTNQSTTYHATDFSNGNYSFKLAFDTEYCLKLETNGKIFESPIFKFDHQHDLFQQIMNFTVDGQCLYQIVDRDLKRIASVKVNSPGLYARASDTHQLSFR